MEKQSNDRGSFSKIGFILAAAGSSVGLGNLWKFPYLTGQNGGGIFVLVYLIMVVTIGFTCMLGETTIGKHTKLNPIGAYAKLSKKFAFVGVLGVLVPFLIVTYYNIIGGWILKYIADFVMGKLAVMTSDPGKYFGGFITSPISPIFWTFVFVIINFVIIRAGVSEGIERMSKILMPALFVILIVVVIRSVTLPGATEGLVFYLKPDFSKLSMATVSAALGQVFFSLSLGMGAIVAYGSYLPDSTDVEKTSIIIPLMDTMAAILAGFAIFPACAAFGIEVGAGPSLIFQTLPVVFNNMPGGVIWAIVFFFLVLFAAVTSSTSLIECPVAWLIDNKGMERNKATILVCVVAFLCAVPESLSLGALGGLTFPTLNGAMGIFDFVGYIAENVLLPASGFFMCIVISKVWGMDNFEKAVTNNGEFSFRSKGFIEVMVKYIAPVLIFIIWLQSIGIWGLIKKALNIG